METHNHMQLKRLALAWLVREGFQAVAPEVRSPMMRYRADVAGYIDAVPNGAGHDRVDPPPPPEEPPALLFESIAAPEARLDASRKRCESRTVLIECKQSRGDFLRDTALADTLIGRRRHLLNQRHALELEFLRKTEPTLRRSGEFLFADMERWDYSRARSPAYRKLLAEIASIDQSLYSQTKFFWMAQYRMADRLFLFAPRAMIKPRELPDGWGLIECPKRLGALPSTLSDLTDVALTLRVPARDNATRATHRHRLLRNIAVAATRSAIQADGGREPKRPAASAARASRRRVC